MRNYTEDLFKAIDTIVNKRIELLPYDQTILATIIDIENASQGQYKISTDDLNSFLAYSDNFNYALEDRVYVRIPQGDWGAQKVIMGKYISGDIAEDIVDNGKFYPTKTSVSISFDTEKNYYKLNKELNGYDILNILIPIKYVPKSTFIKTDKIFSIQLIGDNFNSIKYTTELAKEDYYFNKIYDIKNNPNVEVFYSFKVNMKYFKVKGIKIEDVNENLIINFNNIRLTPGFVYNTIPSSKQYLFIYLDSPIYNEDRTLQENLGYRYDKTVINRKIGYSLFTFKNGIFEEEQPLDKNNIVLDIQVPEGEEGEGDQILGPGWKKVTLEDDIFQLDITNSQLVYKGYYKFSENAHIESQQIVLYYLNINSDATQITQGFITDSEASNANNNIFYIYGQDNKLLDINNSIKQFNLKIAYQNLFDFNDSGPNKVLQINASAEFPTNTQPGTAYIKLLSPVDNSMTMIRDWNINDSVPITFNFYIKNYYSQQNNANDISMLIKYNGVVYNYNQTLVFGTSGSQGTDYNLILELQKYIKEENKWKRVNAINGGISSNYKIVANLYDYDNKLIENDYSITYKHKYNKENYINEDGTFGEKSLLPNDYWDFIVQGTATINNKQEIIAELPIAYSALENYSISGATSIIYDHTGKNAKAVYYKAPYQLFNDNAIVEAEWSLISENNEQQIGYPKLSNNTLFPSILYKDGIKVAVKATLNNNTIAWIQPISIVQNKYPMLGNNDEQNKFNGISNISTGKIDNTKAVYMGEGKYGYGLYKWESSEGEEELKEPEEYITTGGIKISQATNATTADCLSSIDVGSESLPVYFNSEGKPQVIKTLPIIADTTIENDILISALGLVERTISIIEKTNYIPIGVIGFEATNENVFFESIGIPINNSINIKLVNVNETEITTNISLNILYILNQS